MKWILAAAAAIIFAGLLYWLSRSEKVSYVNGLPAYSAMPGREYFLERDCYLFKFKRRNSDWPLIASRATVPGLPVSVDPRNIGAEFPEVRILDVIKTGTRFRIVSVRRTESPASTSITFEILLGDEVSFKYPRVDAYWILDHSPEREGKAPQVMPGYATPRFRY
ncbi:MAG TPA: hypothetical protein VN775_13485 [Opitutaceae bacterium]|nr:hypothetical protein [Opitutaceae bacterium]